MQLPHEDHNHLLLGIDRELGIEESSPGILSRRAELVQRRFHTIHAKPQPKALVWTDLSQLILAHEFDRLPAQQPCIAPLPAIEHHLAEAGIVRRSRDQSRASGKQLLRTTIGII